jgi:hypothetical protein
MTLEQHISELEKDDAYRSIRAANDQQLAELARVRALEQEPILAELAAAGVTVDWIGRLSELPHVDERIYPVLLEHLRKPHNPWLLEWIGRAFGRKAARLFVWDTLIGLLKTHALEERAADGVMVAISAMAQPRDLPMLIELLSDASLGSRRLFLVHNLMQSKKLEARAALLRHKDDPDLTTEITSRLARSRR